MEHGERSLATRAKSARRPHSLNFVPPPRNISNAAPRTHHSLPTARAELDGSDGDVTSESRPLSPSWRPPATRASGSDIDGPSPGASAREGRMPFEGGAFPEVDATPNYRGISNKSAPISPINRGAPVNDEHEAVPVFELGYLPPDQDRTPLNSGDEGDLKNTKSVRELEPGIEDVHFGKLLRKVRRHTDNILTRSTEWRYEYDQLEHRLRFLDGDISNLMAALKTKFPEFLTDVSDGSSFNRKENDGHVQGGVMLSDETSPSDSNTDVSGKSSKGQEGRRDRSSGTGADTRASEGNTISALNNRYHDAYRAVKEQAAKTTRLGDELSNLRYHLQTEMKTVQQKMYAKDFVQELKAEVMDAPLEPSEQESQQSSEDMLPPLVAQYFDKKGDVGIYEERLNECDFNHGEGVTERGFLRERGDQVVPTDSEFEYNYRTRRREIEDDLTMALEEVDILRQRCLDNDHYPEEWRTSRHSVNQASIQYSGIAAPDDIPGPPMIHAVSLGIMASPPQTERHPTNRIDTWLRTMDPDQPPQTDHIEPFADEPVAIFSLAAYESRSFDVDAFCSPRR